MRTLRNVFFIAISLCGFSAVASESAPRTEDEAKRKSAAISSVDSERLKAVYDIMFKKIHVNRDGNIQGPGIPDDVTHGICGLIDERHPTAIPIHYEKTMVRDAALSPDKRFLVLSYFDGYGSVVSLKDFASGTIIRTLEHRRNGKVTISPTTRYVAICSYAGYHDKDIHLWSTTTGAKIRTFSGHGDYGEKCRFSADESCLASIGGLNEGTVKLWDVETGQCMQTKQHGDRSWMRAVDISDDGRLLISGGGTSSQVPSVPAIKVWDVRSSHCEKIIPTKEDLTDLRFIPGGTDFVSSEDYSGIIKRWNITHGEPVCTFAHTMANSIALSREGGYLVSGGAIGPNPSNYVRVWNVNTGACLHELDIGDRVWGVEAVDISADGQVITAVGGYDDSVKVWTKRDMYTLLKLVHARVSTTEKSEKKSS